jgi:hypothetical protein
MEEVSSAEILVSMYEIIGCHKAGYHKLNSHNLENRKM